MRIPIQNYLRDNNDVSTNDLLLVWSAIRGSSNLSDIVLSKTVPVSMDSCNLEFTMASENDPEYIKVYYSMDSNEYIIYMNSLYSYSITPENKGDSRRGN